MGPWGLPAAAAGQQHAFFTLLYGAAVHAVVTVAACHPQPVDEGLLPCMHASLTWGVGLQVFVALSHVNPESQGVASHPCRRKHTVPGERRQR